MPSTFAWFSATSTIRISSPADTNTGAISITEAKANVGEVSVDGLTVVPTTNVNGTDSRLALAHITSSATNMPNKDKSAAPYLTSAYIDSSSNVHELGYTNEGEVVLPTGTELIYGTLTITITTKNTTGTIGGQTVTFYFYADGAVINHDNYTSSDIKLTVNVGASTDI